MKTILLIETKEKDRLLVDDILKKRTNYSLIQAHDGKTALDVLASSHPDLVIVNLDIPQANYLRLIIKYIGKEYFKCPVITLANHYNDDNRTRLDKLGVFKHLEKPLDPKTLIDNVEAELYLRPKSRISGIASSTFFQLIQLDRKTCTLRIINQNRIGVLYCYEGNIVDAVAADLSGTDAAIEIASWDPITIIMQEFCRFKESKFSASMEYILLEGARKRDELNSDSEDDETILNEEDLEKFTFDPGSTTQANTPVADEKHSAFSSYTDIEYYWTELEDIIKAESKEVALSKLTETESITTNSIAGYAVITHEEQILTLDNFDEKYEKFIIDTATNLTEIKDNFDFNNPIFFQLNLLGGKKLLVLVGRQVLVGLIIINKTPDSA